MLDRRAAKTATKLDDQLVPIVRKSLKLVVSIIGTVFILQNLNVDVGSLLAGLGLGGLAFALAAKDTVANFFGSIMIFIDKPFHVGDWIQIGDDVEGTVEEVGFRTTRVRTFYNSMLTVPNARVTDSCVDNLGARQYRRYKADLSLTYNTPPAKISAFCEGVRQLIESLPGMRKDFYLVEFTEFGDSGLNIMVYSFMHTPDWDTELRVRTNFNLAILQLAEDLGVEFAFPTRTLHVDSVAPTQKQASIARKEFTVDELNRVAAEYGPGGKRFAALTISDDQGHISRPSFRGEADG
jgi:MscS family membrane protein